MISFWTTNSSIAQMTASGVKGLVVGSTTGEGESDLIWIGAGSNCVLRQVTPTASITVSDLNCTSSVTRGGTATCTVTPSSVSVSGWQFKDGGGNIVKRATNTGSLTWSGVLVTGGTVSVTPTGGSPLTAAITVNPRNWHTATPSPVEVPNSTFITLPVPPQPTGSDSGLGEFQETYSNPGSSSTFISDNGPNQGYGYYSTQITFTNNFKYEINPDLENTGSTFYSEQCGNYNAQTKPSGFISGSLLLTQTRRHEYNSAVQSHYAFYSNSISGTNNPGNYAESRIASPGTSPSTFDNTTSSGITTRYQNILTAAQVEPYAVNEDADGMFLGNINYAPYISCN